MSDYEVSKSTQSTIFRDTLYFTCDLWLTKIDSKSILWLNIKESLICEYFSLLVQNLLRQIQNKRFFCFKVHLSYHPRIYSACLVFQTQPAEQPALSWRFHLETIKYYDFEISASVFLLNACWVWLRVFVQILLKHRKNCECCPLSLLIVR